MSNAERLIGITEEYKRSSWHVYVVCCATIGGILGIGWGPEWVIGLALLGAMVGDDWARRTLVDRVRSSLLGQCSDTRLLVLGFSPFRSGWYRQPPFGYLYSF